MTYSVAINAKEGDFWYDWFCIFFDVTLHIISFADSVNQAHSGVEDSSLCFLSILVFADFRR